MSNLLNTPFETGLRTLMLLYGIKPSSANLDKIAFFDFFTIYGKMFEVSDKNLHGKSNFALSEYSAKKKLVEIGIKDFILRGFIEIEISKKGFEYYINNEGIKYIDSIESDYKKQYIKTLEVVKSKYDDYSEIKLMRLIHEKAKESLRCL